MTDLDMLTAEILDTVVGGNEYPNEEQLKLGGRFESDMGTKDWVCWDAKNPEYRFCVPASWASLPGGRGAPWYVSREYLDANRIPKP